MKTSYTRVAIPVCVMLCGALFCIAAFGDNQPASGDNTASEIKMNLVGALSAGGLSAEVGHFDDKWSLTQQHDAFQPSENAPPATQPSSQIVSGKFATSAGVFTLTEQMDKTDDGAKFSASVNSDKAIPTNQLYVSFALPSAAFGGKSIKIDDQDVALSAQPAQKGQAQIFASDSAKEISIPTAKGTLTISGDLYVYLQDDREWDDNRFSLRLMFWPNTGDIQNAKIEFSMKMKPSAGQ
jgi:hypothetical protein